MISDNIFLNGEEGEQANAEVGDEEDDDDHHDEHRSQTFSLREFFRLCFEEETCNEIITNCLPF